MDASLPQRNRVPPRNVSARPQPAQCSRSVPPERDHASVNLAAHRQRLPVLKRVDGCQWEVCRDALVAVALWLVLVGLTLFALAAATARTRPTVAPANRLSEVATRCASEGNSADRG